MQDGRENQNNDEEQSWNKGWRLCLISIAFVETKLPWISVIFDWADKY